MEIWFLRHGETEWNRAKRIQGSTSYTDLTEFGIKLAEYTRDGMIASGVRFDRIFTSPYRRAAHTAEIIASAFNIKVEHEDLLKELSFGEYEGTEYGKGKFLDDNIEALFEHPQDYRARGSGETLESLRLRAHKFITKALNLEAQGAERILAVSHGAFMRSVVQLATGADIADFWEGPQPNCAVHVISAFSQNDITLVSRARTFYPDYILSKTLSV